MQKLHGLIFGCPFIEEVDKCPFLEVRKTSHKERYNYLVGLTDKEKLELVNHHGFCLKRRESDKNTKV